MAKTSKKWRRRSAKVDQAAIARAEKMREALNYRRLGYSFQQISETLEVSVSTAHRWYAEALSAIPRQEADEIRREMLHRLDSMMVGLMRNVEDDAADSSTINEFWRSKTAKRSCCGSMIRSTPTTITTMLRFAWRRACTASELPRFRRMRRCFARMRSFRCSRSCDGGRR